MSNRKARLTVILPVANRQELLEKCFFFFQCSHPCNSFHHHLLDYTAVTYKWLTNLFNTVQIAEIFPFTFFDSVFVALFRDQLYFFLLVFAFFLLFLWTIGFIYVVVSKGSQILCLLSICACAHAPFFLFLMTIMMIINGSPLVQVSNLAWTGSKGIAGCREQDKLCIL